MSMIFPSICHLINPQNMEATASHTSSTQVWLTSLTRRQELGQLSHRLRSFSRVDSHVPISIQMPSLMSKCACATSKCPPLCLYVPMLHPNALPYIRMCLSYIQMLLPCVRIHLSPSKCSFLMSACTYATSNCPSLMFVCTYDRSKCPFP